jgi:hypothetical protein
VRIDSEGDLAIAISSNGAALQDQVWVITSGKSLKLTWGTSHGRFNLSDIRPNSQAALQVSFSGFPTTLEISETTPLDAEFPITPQFGG